VILARLLRRTLRGVKKTDPPFALFRSILTFRADRGRAKALKEMIQYMQKHAGVWFARGSEIAELTLKTRENGTKDTPQRSRGGS